LSPAIITPSIGEDSTTSGMAGPIVKPPGIARNGIRALELASRVRAGSAAMV